MTEERRKILEMLAAGQITADDADRLLGALQGAPASASTTTTQTKSAPKFLRVMVDANEPGEGPVHINIRVPIMLLRAGVRLASLIPQSAQGRVNEELRKNGVNFDISQIKPENLNEVIDHLGDMTIDIDQESEGVKIKIFAE